FEGDKREGYRLLRSIKNRFGSTDDLVLLSMTEKGLIQVPNPSAAFLQERVQGAVGSAIVATLKGSRATLIEIQALVAKSSFTTATRRCSGIDHKRLSLLLAVLEKKMGYPLYNLDVFVSSVGGVKISEPAADFAILLAIASSFVNKPLQSDCLFLGEIGLGGEVRSSHRIEPRIKEAVNMGFKKCLLSQKQATALESKWGKKIELVGVCSVSDVIERYLKH
ncbi:DNA repair protein RadA, partial [Candidatus Aerophobetes bacterium]